MISWCAFCQHFQGELPPLDDFQVTHGICAKCAANHVFEDEEAIRRVRPIVEFHRELYAAAMRGVLDEAETFVERAAALGIDHLDLLVGLVQPSLEEVGRRWATSEITVSDEHRFTAFCARIIELIELATVPAPAPVDAVLVNAEGNTHWLGLRVVELWLRRRGLTSRLVFGAPPQDELVRLCEELQPRFVGVSVAIAAQLEALRALAGRLRIPVIAGGGALRAGDAQPPPGVQLVRTVQELDAWLDRML